LLLMAASSAACFHEFAVTVRDRGADFALISLTLTPMMCARFLGHEEERTASSM